MSKKYSDVVVGTKSNSKINGNHRRKIIYLATMQIDNVLIGWIERIEVVKMVNRSNDALKERN